MDSYSYTGRVFYATFKSKTNLQDWLPEPLKAVNPNEGFVKVYSLKRRPEFGDYAPPGFSQYQEVCIAVMATAPGFDLTPRHYNLFMWVDHDWALFRAREVHGWPKKLAQIDFTSIFPHSDGYDRDGRSSRLQVNVSRYGYRILSVEATLDGSNSEYAMPPFGGFYTYRRIAAPLGSSPIEELLVIETRDAWLGEPTFGTASLEFGSGPDEEVNLLGDVTIAGCLIRDIGWTLPGYPARQVAAFEAAEPRTAS
jgi:acetoacetate decarboxylase